MTDPTMTRRRMTGPAGAIVMALAVWLVSASGARATAPTTDPHDLGRVVVKTAVFEVFSSTLETGLFLAFHGAGTLTPGGILAVNVVTSSAVYAAHEYAWQGLADPMTPRSDTALITGKAVTYRALSILRGFTAGYVLGGARITTSAAFALAVAVADSALYAATELGFAWLWDDTPVRNEPAPTDFRPVPGVNSRQARLPTP